MTNFERIKQMTVEDMVKTLMQHIDCPDCFYKKFALNFARQQMQIVYRF